MNNKIRSELSLPNKSDKKCIYVGCNAQAKNFKNLSGFCLFTA